MIKVTIVELCTETRTLGTVSNRQTLTHDIGNIMQSATFMSTYKPEIYNKEYFL